VGSKVAKQVATLHSAIDSSSNLSPAIESLTSIEIERLAQRRSKALDQLLHCSRSQSNTMPVQVTAR
jgi:copper homeostasis protein CutC